MRAKKRKRAKKKRTSIRVIRIDPIDCIEKHLRAAVASVYDVEPLDICIFAEKLRAHKRRFHAFRLVDRSFGTNCEKAN